MIESPVLQRLKAEWIQEAVNEAHRDVIVIALTARFGDEAEGLREKLGEIDDEARLIELVRLAAVCSDLAAFRDWFNS
jgi:hypothetical protein